MDILRAGTRSFAKGPEDWFTGTVRIDPLFNPFDAELQEVKDGKVVDWMEHVTDVQYGA